MGMHFVLIYDVMWALIWDYAIIKLANMISQKQSFTHRYGYA